MPPKKPKRTKEEIEAEKARLAEEARLTEEERLRQEEELRKLQQQIEDERQQLLNEHLAAEAARLSVQREALQPLQSQLKVDRARGAEERARDKEWERHVSCTHLPDPRLPAQMEAFFSILQEGDDESIEQTLTECKDCMDLADACSQTALEAAAAASFDEQRDSATSTSSSSNGSGDTTYTEHITRLYAEVSRKIDAATAHTLHRSDEYANDKGDILLEAQLPGSCPEGLQWGLWVNVHRNPRFKAIELPQLGMTVELPKQIALASVALRIQRRAYDEFSARCTNQWSALGGVLYFDMLALPPPVKRTRGWLLRQVTPLTSHVQQVPYPTPPAGVDAATWKPDEEPLPLRVTVPVPAGVLVPGCGEGSDETVRPCVGWWDEAAGAWSEQGISGVEYDASSRLLSFSTVHLGALALLQDRMALMPYSAWSIRPTSGLGGSSFEVALTVRGRQEPVLLEVGPSYTALLSPDVPELSHLHNQHLPPWLLLQRLSQAGLHLTPAPERDGAPGGVCAKEWGVEHAMCADLALICGNFLVASSRWNKAVGADQCVVRLSEVCDWEEGGRTEAPHLARVFDKEKEYGERRVLAVLGKGDAGVTLCEALDRRSSYPQLPNTSTIEGVREAMASVYGCMHASLLSLLQGPPEELVAADASLASLCATPEGLERCRAMDAVASETLAQVLLALRVFSCA